MLDGLKTAGFDGEAERIRRWMDPQTGPAPTLRRRLVEAEQAVTEPGVLRLGLLISLCRYEQASALSGVLGAEASAWRAELELQSGRVLDAAGFAASAAAESPEDDRGWCLLALAKSSLGDTAAAHAALGSAPARGRPLPTALRALLANERGDMEAAAREVEALLDLRPEAGWPLAIRGMVRWAAGNRDGCLGDLKTALELEPEAAWIWRRYGEYLEKSGRMEEAMSSVRRAIELSLPHPHLHWQSGHLLFYRKQYPAAVQQFSKALELAPDDHAIGWERANALWLSGGLMEALDQARRCLALAPSSGDYRMGVARFLIVNGREADAEAELASWNGVVPDLASGRFYLEGVMLFRRREYAAAAERFELAEKALRAGGCRRPYPDLSQAVLARAMDFVQRQEKTMPKPENLVLMPQAASRPVLILAGLGMRYPYQASLETLRALSGCDVIFSNLAGPEAMEFLTLFCKDVRTVSYENKMDEDRWTEKIFADMAPGRSVGFATRGHPHISGTLAMRLVERARAEGAVVQSFGSISTADILIADAQEDLLLAWGGTQMFDSRVMLAQDLGVRNDIPLILFLGIEDAEKSPKGLAAYFDSLRAYLERSHSPQQTVYLYGPRFESKYLEPVALRDLPKRLGRVEPHMVASTVLFVPPLAGVRSRAQDLQVGAR